MIEGGVYTLSWTGTAQARVYQGTPTGSYAANPIVTPSLTVGTNTIVEFNAGTLGRVKFENGSVATPYNRQSLAKSMADCQRYYSYHTYDMNGYAAASPILVSTFNSLNTQMRTAPTVVYTPGGAAGLGAPSGAAYIDGVKTYFSTTATGTFNCAGTFTASAEL